MVIGKSILCNNNPLHHYLFRDIIVLRESFILEHIFVAEIQDDLNKSKKPFIGNFGLKVLWVIPSNKITDNFIVIINVMDQSISCPLMLSCADNLLYC
jgi:hypothetical protein